MSIANIVVAVFLIVIVIMTFISEPKLSFEYYKAAGKSVGVVFEKARDLVGGWIKEHNEKAGKDS